MDRVSRDINKMRELGVVVHDLASDPNFQTQGLNLGNRPCAYAYFISTSLLEPFSRCERPSLRSLTAKPRNLWRHRADKLGRQGLITSHKPSQPDQGIEGCALRADCFPVRRHPPG